jgi:hypothetical protein
VRVVDVVDMTYRFASISKRTFHISVCRVTTREVFADCEPYFLIICKR